MPDLDIYHPLNFILCRFFMDFYENKLYNVFMNKKIIAPVAYIENDFKEKFGIPRQSGRAPSLISKIIFYPEFRSPNTLRGIEGFSHLWLIFGFSLVDNGEWAPLVRPPRLGGNAKVGVFASRSPFRPNNLGLSSVKLLKIEKTETYGHVLTVAGADLVSGTPIYDIKPYLPFTDCHNDAVGGFADKNENYRLEVIIPDNIAKSFPPEKLSALKECLSDDPRPSYQEDGRIYGMSFAEFNVKFKVDGKSLFVLSVEKQTD